MSNDPTDWYLRSDDADDILTLAHEIGDTLGKTLIELDAKYQGNPHLMAAATEVCRELSLSTLSHLFLQRFDDTQDLEPFIKNSVMNYETTLRAAVYRAAAERAGQPRPH